MKRSSTAKGSSLAIAAVFFASITLLILAGMLLKLFLILRASSFDGVHQYIVEVDESKQKGELVAFTPDTNGVTTLTVTGKVDSTFGKYLKVPVDAKVDMALPTSPTKLVGDMLFKARNEQGMTIIDKLRLLLFVNSLKPTDFRQETLSLPVDPVTADKLLPSLFLDNALYADNQTITVVNGTNASGIASDVAKMLTTIGMNVVSVTTAEHLQKNTTVISANPNSYTSVRLGRFFHVSPQRGKGAVVSSITLTLGTQSLPALQ